MSRTSILPGIVFSCLWHRHIYVRRPREGCGISPTLASWSLDVSRSNQPAELSFRHRSNCSWLFRPNCHNALRRGPSQWPMRIILSNIVLTSPNEHLDPLYIYHVISRLFLHESYLLIMLRSRTEIWRYAVFSPVDWLPKNVYLFHREMRQRHQAMHGARLWSLHSSEHTLA